MRKKRILSISIRLRLYSAPLCSNTSVWSGAAFSGLAMSSSAISASPYFLYQRRSRNSTWSFRHRKCYSFLGVRSKQHIAGVTA